MAENSKIEWTDHTFNPWRGCTHRVLPDGTPHPGCEHCYAETMSKRNPSTLGVWGEGGVRVMAAAQQWRAVEKWNREAGELGRIDRVFCASLADVFEDWPRGMNFADGSVAWWRSDRGVCTAGQTTVSHVRDERLATMDDARRDLFKLIDATPHLFWLLLTKRPENVRRMWCSHVNTDGRPPSMLRRENVAIGTSISDQATADELVPQLLVCRDLAPVLFLSVEPLVGPVDLKPRPRRDMCLLEHPHDGPCQTQGIDWVIVGGESGNKPDIRPMHGQWPRDIRDQCVAAGVPFFFKQWGEWLPISDAPIEVMQAANRYKQTGLLRSGASGDQVTKELCDAQDDLPELCYRVGKHAAGRLLDEREWNELPAALAVAEAAR